MEKFFFLPYLIRLVVFLKVRNYYLISPFSLFLFLLRANFPDSSSIIRSIHPLPTYRYPAALCLLHFLTTPPTSKPPLLLPSLPLPQSLYFTVSNFMLGQPNNKFHLCKPTPKYFYDDGDVIC